jgi:quinolinate synthase
MTRINYVRIMNKVPRTNPMNNKQSLITEIQQLKEKLNAVILAHVYQEPEIQDIADFTGDSLELSKKAVNTNADIIVFCGVTFMAETAHILNPQKTVLTPDRTAGCNLADMATLKTLHSMKKKHPDAAVVSYVNSSAEIKAESDICCTSANAVRIVESLNSDDILFLPDRNLGSYVAEQTTKNIILWGGFCYVHEQIKPETIRKLRSLHPDAKVISHPECNPTIRSLSDMIGSTSKMASYVSESEGNAFIVATDDNFIHHVQTKNPSKTFYAVGTTCTNMRKITLERLYDSLKHQQYTVTLPEEICRKAKHALDAMMKVS